MIEQNAIITKAELDIGDRGYLQGWIHLDYGGSGQGFGGHCLHVPKGFTHHSIKGVAGHWITRVMQVAGVGKWDQLEGKTIRVRKSDYFDTIQAIGHIVKNDWFNPSEDFKKLEEN